MTHGVVSHERSGKFQRPEPPFPQPRYYDFRVWSKRKRAEKLKYTHRNPVRRGPVSKTSEWPWSSFNHGATGTVGAVETESQWIAPRREAQDAKAHVPNTGRGAPRSVRG